MTRVQAAQVLESKLETMNLARISSAILATALGFAATVEEVQKVQAESVNQ